MEKPLSEPVRATATPIVPLLPQSSSKLVRLNVGGVLYCTTEATLLGRGENFFSGLLSGKIASMKDNDGAFFIDRNGPPFGVLLNFLRTGSLFIPKDIAPESVLIEANFYLIDVAPALGGLIPEGLYTSVASTGTATDGAFLHIEKDPDNPSAVAITGIIDNFLFVEQICFVEHGRVSLRTPLNEYYLRPEGSSAIRCWAPTRFKSVRIMDFTAEPSDVFPLEHNSYSFEFPIDEDESDFTRGYLTFLNTGESIVARIQMAGTPSIFSVRTLSRLLMLLMSTPTKPYGLVYLSGKVPFFFVTRRSGVKAFVLRKLLDP